jgi:hypothetical protein
MHSHEDEGAKEVLVLPLGMHRVVGEADIKPGY